MIRLVLLFLLPFTLYGSKILSYNIYDRTDRVDVMITFDTPYEGIIKQSVAKSTIIIKLEEASIESAKIKQLSSKFLTSLSITPMAGYTQITATVPPSVQLKASKTSDSYGLRLRFLAQTMQANMPTEKEQASGNLLQTLPTKKGEDLSMSYYIVIATLVVGIIILFFLKTKITSKKQNSSWLFNPNQTPATQPVAQPNVPANNVSIRFQKSINEANTVVMLDYGEQSYLVLMGSSNILLDKFTDDKPITEDEFEKILQSRHQQLDEFLRVENHSHKEPFQSYKEKASSISYEV
ncbi:MAG: hypothetical protein AB7U44_11705 [Sulfuricurvum sp.]|jgi:hypothetical protein|nr:hypothetical protein [Sulfurimonadaceae bacterium]MDD3817235.1 hypothetical protein [Sulfurimonadaceae bacterium]